MEDKQTKFHLPERTINTTGPFGPVLCLYLLGTHENVFISFKIKMQKEPLG